jgi:pimeloyl-ACP methyl ester carboxylesterase
MPTVLTSTLSIHFTDTGPVDAPRVVILVHGWPDAARGWNPLRDALGEAGWRVIVPDLRGHGETRFSDIDSVRDGSAVALARDVVDLADALRLERFAVVGHDWGARAAYTLGALFPERLTCAVALALGYQPRGEFRMPPFDHARRFWYQWLMYVDDGAEAIRRDPMGFARIQWETWSPAGWYDDEEFAVTASAFANPDWVEVTLNAYRSRIPTLMIQGGDDQCDPPQHSEGLDSFFDSYRREVIDAVGHFPHREACDEVARLVIDHLAAFT